MSGRHSAACGCTSTSRGGCRHTGSRHVPATRAHARRWERSASSQQDAATAAGYDLGAYGRIAYVLPDQVCSPLIGLGAGREVFIAEEGGTLDDFVFVHELGHTFGLPHAARSSCARGCRIDESGDPLSPMGNGDDDFSALEKLELGWITSVQSVDRPGKYSIANIDAPSSSPQALVVPTAAGEYWIEHRAAEPRRVVVRLVKPIDPTQPRYVRSIFLARAEDRYVARGVFSVTRGFQFKWLDRKRPSTPRARALDHAWLSWARSSDSGSGVAVYRVSLDGRLLATTTDTGIALPPLSEGGHRVTVVAFDRAGNRSLPAVVNLHR